VLAGRYRIHVLIGQGGMGEVYRAHDLILNQPVALKFVGAAHMNEATLARFRNEVRIARQVSHPNVCRVYDIGFADGLHFLSMEYLDGEDLASLLRRIGRLPQDKALEFTRKICAGLGAAHERGVLHRDLKPGNIMIDGRGHVRITDFGLAALAVEIPLSDVRSGTPAYMSPEQKTGKEVTTRSDLYSLGLVLHEMFTGKRRGDSKSSLSELVKDLDPAVERIILRCLEEEPKRRPASALHVAMALPGGDPIAAALAAGETPSPEMVAASQEKEGLSPYTAMACFAGVIVLLAAISFATGKLGILSRAPVNTPPDGMAVHAQDILKQLGYLEKPVGTAYGFDCCDADYLRYVGQFDPPRRDALLATHQPAVIRFWYRQHQSEFLADSFMVGSPMPPLVPLNGAITYNSPANTEPGMVRMALDATGRLIGLEARPSAEVHGTPASPPDWTALFTVAGLDMARFTLAQTQQIPPMAFDTRMAWVGSYAPGGIAGERAEQVRVEAASWEGRLVYFHVSGDWQPAVSLPPPSGYSIIFAFGISMLLAGALLARRNVRLGRGDRAGAARLAGFVFLVTMINWILVAAHVAGIWELALFAKALCFGAFMAGVLWLGYLAVEPYARRYWPDALISSTRIQSGHLRDSLVASHVLVGVLAQASVLVASLAWVWAFGSGRPIFMPRIDGLSGPAYAASLLCFEIARTLGAGMAILVLVILLRLLVRRMWLADVLGAVIIGGVLSGVSSWLYQNAAYVAFTMVTAYALLVLLRRFGLLTLWVGLATNLILTNPVSVTGWYGARSLMVLAIPAAAAAWALWVILSAQRQPVTESSGY